jgi:hypothetical protein
LHVVRPHIAPTTVNLLNTWHWETLPHPPCNLDLAPSDFHLFPKFKKCLRGQSFRTDEVQEERPRSGCVCRTRHFTSKAMTLWPTAMITASTDMATTSANRLHMCLYITHVLFAVTCLYYK